MLNTSSRLLVREFSHLVSEMINYLRTCHIAPFCNDVMVENLFDINVYVSY